MDAQAIRGKFRGALLGVAIGDALGAPFEGAATVSASQIAEVVAATGPLRFTDDTQMTLGVAESLVEQSGFDGAHMAAVFARNFAAEPWRGYGAGAAEVFRLIAAGVSWQDAAGRLFGGRGSFGNGAAMRAAPIGLVGCPRLPETVRLARQCARITHAHPLGIEGAVLQACAITLLLQFAVDELDIPHFLAMLKAPLESSAYGEKLDRIGQLLAGGRRDQAWEFGNGVAAVEAVPSAVYAFLRTPASFTDVVTYAVSLGGDTDTIASMAGALAGAYLGEDAIPADWRARVEGAAQLQGMADCLLLLAAGRVGVRPASRFARS